MSATFRRFSLTALSFAIPVAIIACGGDDARTVTTTAGARTPEPTVTVKPAVATTTTPVKAAPAAAVSYDDAEAVFREGRYAEAADLFQSYADRKPENAFAQYMLGMSAWRAGDLHRAEQAFDRALELDPAHLKSLLNSSRVLLDLGRPTEALDRIQLAVEQDTVSAEGLRLLGRAWALLNEPDRAIEAYRSALIREPDDYWSMNNLGLIYLEQGQPEQALAPLARAAELRPSAPVFQNNLGIALERIGQPAAAARAFEAALRADSTYGKASVSLERVQPLIATAPDSVNLGVVSEGFRLQERMWQDQSVIEEQVDSSAVVPDSVKQL